MGIQRDAGNCGMKLPIVFPGRVVYRPRAFWADIPSINKTKLGGFGRSALRLLSGPAFILDGDIFVPVLIN